MATVKEVIYDVKESLKKYSDDSEYDDRYILYLYNIKRAKYLRQLLDDKTRGIDSVLIQSLCLEFEEVDKGLCGLEVGCTIMKSVKPLPKLLEVRNRNTLISIQPAVMLSKQFKVIDFTQASYILDRPYSNGIYVTVDADGYIYLISNNDEHKLITCLYLTALFENPSDLEDYTNCCGCEIETADSCFEEDSIYPAPSFIIDLCRDEIIKLLLGTREQIKEDKDNNSDDQ